jgi:hypothetical protein
MNLPGLGWLPRRLRLLLFSVFAPVPLGAGLVTFLLFTVFAPPPPPFTPRRSIPLTDLNPYGANFFLEREVEAWKRERTLTMARSAGITWARQQFPWEEIESTRGEFDWDKYDGLVDLYARNGIQIIARLDRPPLWARNDASGTGSSGPPDDFNTYGDFVEAFARHYQGKIYYLQIWNEPNLAREWNDAPIDPAAYTNLLKIAYDRAKAVDPNIRILTAPLAITLGEPYPKGENVFRNMNDLLFLDEMYAAGAKDYFDILSANAFGLGNPPQDPPDPGTLNFQRVMLERQVMERNGDQNKSVWIDEYGWNAPPAAMPDSKLIWGRVTEEKQADYTVRGIEFARKNWDWVGVISIWFFRQVGDISLNNPEYYFRMVDVDFTPRPVYLQVAQAANSAQVAGPGQYEETNPALQGDEGWKPKFDPRASAGEELVTTTAGAHATLRFWGEGVDLIAHKGREAGRLIATLDGGNVSDLPRDANGRSYVELAQAKEEWQSIVPVERGLSRGVHTLDLVAAGNANLDGFTVPEVDNPAPPWLVIVPLVVLGMISSYFLYKELRVRR